MANFISDEPADMVWQTLLSIKPPNRAATMFFSVELPDREARVEQFDDFFKNKKMDLFDLKINYFRRFPIFAFN